MPTVDLDFGSVDDRPEGWYRLTCAKPVYKKNKAGDGFIINLEMKFTDMPDEWSSFENQKLYDQPSLAISARWKLKEVLEAFTNHPWDEDNMKIEWECEQECEAETYDECPHTKIVPDLVDTTAVGLIYAGEYKGRINCKVKQYLPDDGTVEIGSTEEVS
jgi:hypothetical protein